MALSARYSKATDTFDSSISSDWENGGGDWQTFTWVSGGHIQNTFDAVVPAAMRRQANPSSFGNNQYSKVVLNSCDALGGALALPAATVRMASGTDESAYAGCLCALVDLGAKYIIYEIDSSFGFTELASGTAGAPSSYDPGTYIVFEVSGTGSNNLELFTSENGGAETSRLTASDATITSGSPGLWGYRGNSGDVLTITSWEGGDDQAAGASFSPSAGSLTLTGVAPVITEQLKVSPSAGALTLAGVAPTVSVSSAGVSVTVDGATLTLAGSAPTIAVNQSISPAAGALSLTGVAPTLATDNRVSVTAGTLTIAGYAPTVTQGVSIGPAAGALTITGAAPTVTEQIKVTPDAGTLVIAGAAPGVFVGAPGEFAPAAAVLTLTGVAPTVTQQVGISPAAGTLTLEGAAPSVRTDTLITVEPAELTVAGYAPVVAVPLNFMVEPAQIVLTGVAPTVAGGEAMPAEGMTHAGAKRRRRKRYLVEIDGQDFEVSSVEEAQELLARAEEVAQEQARVAVERSANASRRQRRKVVADARKALSLPQVRVAGSESDQVAAQIERQARLFVDRVSDLYREAMQAVEIGALLRRVAAEEEEDAIVVMLMNL